MRAWGLAEGLHTQGVQTTVAVNNSFPQELDSHQGIRLTNWGLDERFADLINSYDAVIMSYCMGDASVFVADKINDEVQLILDAYVPIYVEVAARESNDIDNEYLAYLRDIKNFNHVLRRGDYFLCANDTQKTLYIGVLASLGIINPRSYREERIIVAPFGIHDVPPAAARNPYKELGIKKSDFTLMWFGGLYPWFRIEELLQAILRLSKNKDFKFVIVGGKNPFNSSPDFVKQYEKTLAFATKHKLIGSSVFFVDWVDFDDRINWFRHADMVISLNQPGQENGFSWRTRVMDFVWGELAILTNGGDPLSEELIAAEAAIRLPELSSEAIVREVQRLYTNREQLKAIRTKVAGLKDKYYWPTICKPIAELIKSGATPYVGELAYKRKLHISPDETQSDIPTAPASGTMHKVKKLARLPGKIVSYARRKGLRRSAALALMITRTQVRTRLARRGKRFVFISHPIDHTGAPIVLMQMLQEYATAYGAKNIHLVAPYVAPDHLRKLREMGVKVDKAAHAFGHRLVKLQLNLRPSDTVIMNTVAIYDNYRDYVMHALGTGQLKHAYWYIHEDEAQLPTIKADLLEPKRLEYLHNLIAAKKLSILVPSERTREQYNRIFNVQHVHVVPLLIKVPRKYQKERPARDYKRLDFIIAGTPSDGRKGQLIALAAFNEFMHRYHAKQPKLYRDFTLHLFSIGNDYMSQQIKWVGNSLLGKHVATYSSMPQREVFEKYASCNAVICCSLNETFALYVAEAMLMGHVVLRNNTAGVDEQLHEGKNGYLIDHTDVPAFAATLEKILNKRTSDAELAQMGRTSQQMMAPYQENSYIGTIESIVEH